MKVAITGSNGYLGKKISQRLIKDKIDIVQIPRNMLYSGVNELSDVLATVDAVINLAGSPILSRWTKKGKKRIFNSRVVTTKNLTEAIGLLPIEKQPNTFISASAIGLYKSGQVHNEKSTSFEYGFTGEVVECWENASGKLPSNTRRVIFRIGIVIGKEAKAIKSLNLPFKLGLGSTIGNGEQPFPFVHIDDVVEAFYFALTDKSTKGVFNLVAPQNISNKNFTRIFAEKINRPAFLKIPSFVLKLVFGKAASLLIESPQAIPEALVTNNFQFKYPNIESALTEIFR